MKKIKFLNNYKSYAYTKDYTILNKLSLDTIKYIKENNLKNLDVDFSNVAINKEFIDNFNIAINLVFNNTKLVGKWGELSNTQKKKVILFNLITFSLKQDLFFDRSISLYNKQSLSYQTKGYTKEIKLKLNELFYQIALYLSDDTFYIEM